MYRKLQIIYLLATTDKCTFAVLEEITGLSSPTLVRQLNKLRNDFDMTIEFIHWKGLVGRIGYYQITDWGVLNESRVLQLCISILGDMVAEDPNKDP